MTVLSIDIETYSSVDLTKSGVYRYVEAPDFEILLFAYAYDDEPVQVVDLTAFEDLPEQVLHDLTDPNVIKTAFNANFERVCIGKNFGIYCDPSQWQCTSVWALTLGLPGYLEGVAEVLKLEAQKDARGKNLIKYFSVPCKPTKSNGGRSRNYPYHDPEKWQQYIEYNRQDVVVEREIRRKLSRFPVPAHEWKLWALDQKINDRGVRLDPELVRQAIACDAQYEERLMQEARELTGLDNPNSLTQLKEWLADRGLDASDGLSKDQMPAMLEYAPDDEVRRVLELRQELSKTSVDKYNAMDRSMCVDERARGLLQFYGANRTGRWAGRLIQVQNLPQNKIEDLALARETLRSGDFEMVEMMFGPPPFVLSQLIRTAFVPSDGCRFIVSDFSAIESRVISWLADEHWKLEIFSGHGKIYEATAARMFKVPFETITKGNLNYELRAKGKVAELACLSGDTLVLTDKGLVALRDVSPEHRIWDGMSWVCHSGVVFKGVKETLSLNDLRVTPDHLILTEKGWRSAIESEGHLWAEVSLPYCAQESWYGQDKRKCDLGIRLRLREFKERRGIQSEKGRSQVLRMQSQGIAEGRGYETRDERNSGVLLLAQNDRQVRISFKSILGVLRRPRYSGMRAVAEFVRKLLGRYGPYSQDRSYDRKNRHERALRAGELPVGDAERASSEPQKQPNNLNPLGGNVSLRGSGKIRDQGEHTPLPVETQSPDRKIVFGSAQREEVFDLIYAGPLNRFTVWDGVGFRIVHNCGYQGGPNALVAMGALKSGIQEDELPGLVKQWRQANPNIVKLWFAAEDAAVTAVREKTTVKLAHGVKYRYKAGVLFADLPSGRSLSYVNPRIKPEPNFNKDGLVFDGMDQVKKKWMSHRTYGGRLVENLVQAIARDCLAESLIRLDTEGYKIVMHVHDEVVLDVPIGTGSVEHVTTMMSQPIDWAPGLPLAAAGFECEFYQKD